MDTADIQRQKTLEEIQKMTGSVKMLSEKQIGEMDERFVQQQLAFETTQERRKNFMEGRGMTVSPAFIETNARVINNEKVHSRGDKKSLRRQKDTYTEIFNDRYAQMNADRQELRDAFEQDEETSFIHARAFASAYQYDTLRDAKKWMTENPERYAANKKAVNAIYRDLYAASEVYGTYTTKAVTYDALYNDIEEKKARMSPELVKQMHSEFDRRSDIEAARQRLVERRISLLTRALEELLRGREQNDMVKEVLREYMPMDYTNSEKEEMRRHAGGAREREEAGIAAVKPTDWIRRWSRCFGKAPIKCTCCTGRGTTRGMSGWPTGCTRRRTDLYGRAIILSSMSTNFTTGRRGRSTSSRICR